MTVNLQLAPDVARFFFQGLADRQPIVERGDWLSVPHYLNLENTDHFAFFRDYSERSAVDTLAEKTDIL